MGCGASNKTAFGETCACRWACRKESGAATIRARPTFRAILDVEARMSKPPHNRMTRLQLVFGHQVNSHCNKAICVGIRRVDGLMLTIRRGTGEASVVHLCKSATIAL